MNKKKFINEKFKTSWIEKYRVTKLDDIIGNNDIIHFMKNIKNTKSMPNLLLWGSPGVGKTSVSLSLCYELYGFEKFEKNVLELNASDERGINVVRDKIINFAKLMIPTQDPNYPSPQFKIIILDEAESMTKDAQTALRKVMETYSHITRYIFICNNVNNIIEPIQSRCMKLKFKTIQKENIKKKIIDISMNENINITKTGVDAVIQLSKNDIRKCILLLQNLKYLNIQLNKKNIYKYFNYITFDCFQQYVQNIKTCDDVLNISINMYNEGYNFESIIQNYVKFILNLKNIDDKQKSHFLFDLSNVENKIIEGCNEQYQLWILLNNIKKLINT